MILVLAGTSEGRQAALALQENGYKNTGLGDQLVREGIDAPMRG
ncbi:MAG: hypothetical protein ACOX0Q_02870 [Syntrophomonadaceae bacterium]|jgi:hypothetical protein